MHNHELINDAKETYQLAQIQFINTELDLGITFCHVAKATGSAETKTRNISNARTAFKTALEYLQEATIPVPVRQLLLDKIYTLEVLLTEYDEF